MFQNYQADYDILQEEEVRAIAAAVESVLNHVRETPTAGSFLLVGQKNGEESGKAILKFNFETGAIENRLDGESSCQVVDHMVEESLPVRVHGGCICGFEENSEELLSLETKHGRFLCAACVGDYPYCEVEIYLAAAKALYAMRKIDLKLKSSYKELFRDESSYNPNVRWVDEHIAKMFDRCREPELRTWKEWRKTAGWLMPYFESE